MLGMRRTIFFALYREVGHVRIQCSVMFRNWLINVYLRIHEPLYHALCVWWNRLNWESRAAERAPFYTIRADSDLDFRCNRTVFGADGATS